MPAVTVEEMLAARDARAARQRELAREFGNAAGDSAPSSTTSVVSVTVVVPGPDKTPEWTGRVFREAMTAASDALDGHIALGEGHLLPTGPQGYLVATLSPLETKRRLVAVEDTHPHGRLFDLDVVVDGTPLTRADIDAPPRRCLVCDGPAAPCARSRAHDLADLARAITEVLT